MLHADNRSEIYAELIRDKPVNNKQTKKTCKKYKFSFIQKQNILNRTTVTKYSYQILLKPADELPEDVNPELREVNKIFRKKKQTKKFVCLSMQIFLL